MTNVNNLFTLSAYFKYCDIIHIMVDVPEEDIILFKKRVGDKVDIKDSRIMVLKNGKWGVMETKSFHKIFGKMLKTKLQHWLRVDVSLVNSLFENIVNNLLIGQIESVQEFYGLDELERVYVESDTNGCSSCLTSPSEDSGRELSVRNAVTIMDRLGYGVIQYDKGGLRFRCLVLERGGDKYISYVYCNKQVYGSVKAKLLEIGYKELDTYDGTISCDVEGIKALPYFDTMDSMALNVNTNILTFSNKDVRTCEDEGIYEIDYPMSAEYLPKIIDKYKRKHVRHIRYVEEQAALKAKLK